MRLPDPAAEGYADGFSRRTLLGAMFVAVVMMPGSIYLGLVAGNTLGAAAEWVTVILFVEIARRSMTTLSRQEVFVLFYVSSGVAAATLANLSLSGGPFAHAIWGQYLVQSPQTETIAQNFPDWAVPPSDSPGVQNRNLLHMDWWRSASKGFIGPITLIVFGQILGRVAWFGLGYILFRLTSDIERLPFPIAPVAAEGVAALAEATERPSLRPDRKPGSSRWNQFSIGAFLGIVFGAVYILLPVATGLFLARPLMALPIPFIDFTSRVEGLLPGSLVSISFDLLLVLIGMILPFPLVMGMFAAVVATSVIGNPILVSFGLLEHWSPGNRLLVNQLILNFDFWMSVSCGLAIVVAAVGLWKIATPFFRGPETTVESGQRRGDSSKEVSEDRAKSNERGDFPTWAAAMAYLAATACFALLSLYLVPGFPWWIVLAFGFVWTPLHSYISARLVGITGMGLNAPYLKETAFVLSGYRGIDVWFAPVPLADYGDAAQRFREMELTRTKFTSILKAELVVIPISLVSSFLFWWIFWRMNQIPSDQFPFAERTWPVQARQAYLILTANVSEQPLLLEALKPAVIGMASVIGFFAFGIIQILGLPVSVFYGMVGGVAAPLHAGLPLFVGALFGRFYFEKKFGKETWSRSIPIIAAGFACGMGLAGMIAVACAILSYGARQAPF